MVLPFAGAFQRYIFDPSVGAVFDTLTGQYINPAEQTAPPAEASPPPSEPTSAGAFDYPIPEIGETGAPIPPGPGGRNSSSEMIFGPSEQWGRERPGPPLPVPAQGWTGEPIPPPSTAPAPSGGGTTSGGAPSGGWTSSGGGYGSSYGGGRSSGSGYSPGSSFGSSSDPMSNIPSYANGTVHPAVSGEPLTPGGQFNDGSSGYDYGRFRGRIGGHPYAVWQSYRRLPPSNFFTHLGWEERRPTLAGSLRSSIMDRVNQTAMSAVQPGNSGMMAGPQGVPTTTTAGTPGAMGGGMGPTGMRGMRGWARQQGFTPASLQDIYYNPQWLYPHINRGLRPGTSLFNQVDDLLSPNLQSLWMGSAGARRVRNPNGLGPDQYANWINRTVGNYMTPGGQVFNANRLIQGLTLPKRNSTQWMANQGATFGEQAYNLQNQIGSVAAVTMNPMAASATMAYLDTLLNRAGSRNLKRGPNRQINPGNVVARNLFR